MNVMISSCHFFSSHDSDSFKFFTCFSFNMSHPDSSMIHVVLGYLVELMSSYVCVCFT